MEFLSLIRHILFHLLKLLLNFEVNEVHQENHTNFYRLIWKTETNLWH